VRRWHSNYIENICVHLRFQVSDEPIMRCGIARCRPLVYASARPASKCKSMLPALASTFRINRPIQKCIARPYAASTASCIVSDTVGCGNTVAISSASVLSSVRAIV
jgi:hypothetical protein